MPGPTKTCSKRRASAWPKHGARGGVTVFLVLFYLTLSAMEVILLLCFIVRGSHGTSIEGIAKVA